MELGSGHGYWASLLDAAGGNVTAVDSISSRYEHKYFAATIEQDGAAYLREHGGAADSILFICWGDWGSGMEEALAEFKGKYLAVVGEVEGCTWWPKEECSESDSGDDAENGSDDDDDNAGSPASASLNNVMDGDDDDDDDKTNERPEEAGLQQQWKRICTVTLPKWDCINDFLAIFERT